MGVCEIMEKKFITLEDVLGKDVDDLAELKTGDIETEKLGLLPFTALDHTEYKECKKQCVKRVPDGTGGTTLDMDDDKLMVKVIIKAVDKDNRSNFTFADKKLIEKLQKKYPDVISADQAVTKLLSPGEIYRAAIAIQDLSGFTQQSKQQLKEEIKN
jgi:hypothetical protein